MLFTMDSSSANGSRRNLMRNKMNTIIYVVGFIVVVGFVLKLLGLY